ncbi:kinase-like domain-containing protein [Pilaira anomala]|nr:kinase-like domain-containing protein [Pilaira anomala]
MSTAQFSAPHLAKAKSSTNLLDRIKLEQSKIEEQLAIEYLNKTLNLSICLGNLQQELKDGIILCNLVNHIRPGTIKMVAQKKGFAFIQMDNITRFLQGVRQLGMEEPRLFEANDLHGAKDMSAVINTILTLAEFSSVHTPSLLKGEEEVQGDVKGLHKQHISTHADYTNGPLRVNTREFDSLNGSRPPKSPLRSCSLNTGKRTKESRSNSVSSSTSSCSSSSSSSSTNTPLTPPIPITPRKNSAKPAPEDALVAIDEDVVTIGNGKIVLEDEGGITTYQLGNCIGKGQFGSVYRTLDLSTGEVVAVKRVKLENDDLYQEIIKEVNILKTLTHTNVVKYIGFIPTKQYLNIVLEYAENGSLMSTLKAFGAFPEKLVASFCIKILRGLEYLHENQVVHCDLKAANILTTKTGDVKLTDFGVSLNLKIKAVDADSISGTPNWMAPEVIELKGATTKSDVWSLGCTLVELVTGKPPYSDLLAMSAMFHIVEDDYPPLPENISQDMKDFLLCCFQKDPENRSSSTELLQHDWIIKNKKKATTSKKNKDFINSQDSTPYHLLEETSHATPKKKTAGVTNTKYYSLNANTILPPSASFDDANSHHFIQTSFGKAVECKVCNEVMANESVFCEVCSLVCHKECKQTAFSCPPRVNDQQPSYDWVFSAKIYNRSTGNNTINVTRGHIPQEFSTKQINKSNSLRETRSSSTTVSSHPQAESIRKYSRALGLTAQEQIALCENPALLMHTMSMEKTAIIPILASENETLIEKLIRKRHNSKKHSADEQCIIS